MMRSCMKENLRTFISPCQTKPPSGWKFRNSTLHQSQQFLLSMQKQQQQRTRKQMAEGEAHTLFKIEIIGCFGWPQPHGVDGIVLVSWDRGVIRHGKDYLKKGKYDRSGLAKVVDVKSLAYPFSLSLISSCNLHETAFARINLSLLLSIPLRIPTLSLCCIQHYLFQVWSRDLSIFVYAIYTLRIHHTAYVIYGIC